MQKADLRSANLNLLVVFQALLETRNVTAAAEKLRLSQPAVSRSLAQLRDLFEDPLFVRTAHGMLATPRAEALTEPLRDALEAAAGLLASKPFDPSQCETLFRVAATDYGAATVLPAALARFARAAPEAAIDIRPLGGEILRDLAEGQADMALFTHLEAPANLWSRDLFEDRYVCLLRRDHPLARQKGRTLDLEDFLAWPHASVSVFGARRDSVDRALDKLGLERRTRLWVPYVSAAPLMVAESDAILTLPSRMAQAFEALPTLARFEPPTEIGGFTYRLYWHERTRKDPAQAWLRQLLAESAERQHLPITWSERPRRS